MNYHFVQQEDWNDCGLACLSMLIENYQRKRVSINQLKNQLNSTPTTGLSFFALIELGQKYKLAGEGFNCETLMLSENAHLCPMILNVQNQEGISHYVILNKIENGFFYLSDPSQNESLTKLTFADLSQIFLNKILIFKKIGQWKPKLNFSLLQKWTSKFYFDLFCLVFFALLANFFWFLTAGFIKTFSQWIFANQINWWELVVFVIFVFCGCFFDFCQDYFAWILSEKTWWQLLTNFLNQKPKEGIEERILSRNLTILRENLEFIQLFWKMITKSLVAIIFVPILEIWISQINFLFCFLPILWILLILFGKIFVKKKIPDQKIKLKLTTDAYQQSLNHYFNFAEEIHNRGLKKVFLKNLEKQNKEAKSSSGWIYQWQTLINFWEKFWVKTFYFILLVIVYYSLQIKSFNDGELLYLIILSNYTLSLLNQIADVWIDFFLIRNQNQELAKFTSEVEEKSLSFLKVDEISFENLILENAIINEKFTTSFFVQGNEKIVEDFFQAILKVSIKSTEIKINQQSWKNFQNDFFILTKNSQLLPGTLAQNLFNWNSDLDSQIFDALSPLVWLEEYDIDFSKQNLIQNLSLQQKQLVNFLSAFFSFNQIFLFENCLSELKETDQEKLIQLFFKLKPNSFVIFSAQDFNFERNFCQKLVLSPMI